MFTIHNLKYQGVFAKEVLGDILGLGEKFLTAENLGFYGGVNFMKAALIFADRITTVSPTYAQEIQNAYYGEKLEGLLQMRSKSLVGILNGVDYETYNPDQDPYLLTSLNSSPQAKEENKADLQRVLGLSVRGDVPVLGIVSRLVDQKGLDLLKHVMEEILTLDVQLVILGTGEHRYEEMLQFFAGKYPERMAAIMEYSDAQAHKIYAGADIFLMPSRFEPCGISQMIAMRYGTIPVVRQTGGLKDTVFPYNENSGEGNGFCFVNYNAHEFLFAVQRAVRLFREDKSVWNKITENALKSNFSWEQSAQVYIQVYESLL